MLKFRDIQVGGTLVDALNEQYEVVAVNKDAVEVKDKKSGNFIELTREITLKYVRRYIKPENDGIVCINK